MTLNITALLTRPSFSGYVAQEMIRKNALIQSGAMQSLQQLNAFMASGGNTTTINSWQPLVNDADQVTTNTTTEGDSQDVASSQEIAVRLNRAQVWAAGDLVESIAGSDPMEYAATQLVEYWNARIQAAFIATWQGVVADNIANDSNDMVNDITGTYTLGTTTFTASAFEDTILTLSDMMDGLSLIMVHPVVYTRMKKNDLIDFITDSTGGQIATYRGLRVLVDATMPVSSNDYVTWIFGTGATGFGTAPVKTPIAIQREEREGTGGGMEYLASRQQFCIHPRGFAYTGTATGAGPANTVLDDAASWNRVWASRKQIKFAQLETTEA